MCSRLIATIATGDRSPEQGQTLSRTSSCKAGGIASSSPSCLIQALMLRQCSGSGSLHCQVSDGKRCWKATPCSPEPLATSSTSPVGGRWWASAVPMGTRLRSVAGKIRRSSPKPVFIASRGQNFATHIASPSSCLHQTALRTQPSARWMTGNTP